GALRMDVRSLHGRRKMAKFLFQARYTTEGAKGLAKDGGTGRRAAIEKMCAEAGGKLESFYFAFGDVDAYVTCDLPDATTAAAIALAVNQAGRASTTTTVLLTPEDFDKAAKKSVSYRPPGG
ncbi:MAG TPA: GYD domain-containing protein, partial [Casimicrobiaceae bacterium]|nr:GYD domain-containing protein [Casimicrobiaceae bacterium]